MPDYFDDLIPDQADKPKQDRFADLVPGKATPLGPYKPGAASGTRPGMQRSEPKKLEPPGKPSPLGGSIPTPGDLAAKGAGKKPSFMEELKSAGSRFGHAVHELDTPKMGELGGNIAKDFQAGVESVKAGGANIGKAYGNVKGGQYGKAATNALKGAVQAPLGALGAAYSPVSGTSRTVVGEPVERASGSKALGTAAEMASTWALPGAIMTRLQEGRFRQVKDIFSPETNPEGGMAAGASVREHSGVAARETRQSEATLRTVSKTSDAMTPEEHINLMDAMQTGKIADLPPDHKKMAETIKGVFDDTKDRLSTLTRKQDQRFRENYFPEQFERPPRAGVAKERGIGEGNGGFLLPQDMTIKEALQNGAVLKTTNALEATAMYKANADKFIATERIFEQGRQEGNVRYLGMHDEIPKGWAPVKGRLGEAPGERGAYAPAAWAKVYNAHISKGMTGNSIYEAANATSNAAKSMKLGLSGYHLAMETLFEAPASMASKGVSELASGHPVQAAKSFIKTPFAAISTTMTGSKALKIYETGKGGTAQERELVDILTRGGARMGTGRQSTSAGMEMASKGPYTLKDLHKVAPALRARGLQLTNAFRKAAGKPIVPPPGAVASRFMRDGQEVSQYQVNAPHRFLNMVGRTMDTMMSPMFDQLIPRMKNGANMELMGAWLRANPTAPHEAQVAAARKIVDSIDNRFGEMVQDNIFWDKTMKQAAQLATVSYSYELGTVRELGGGVQDILKGKSMDMGSAQWSPKMAYTLTYPIIQSVNGAVYQYLKTGKGPESPMDLLAPQTGGKDAKGQPERMSPIGYGKEPYTFINEGPMAWAYGKMGPMAKMGSEMASGKDYRGDPIARPQGVSDTGEAMPGGETMAQHAPDWITAWAKHIGEAFVPIPISGMASKPPGSNIGAAESVMGARPAGMQYTDPERLEAAKKGLGKGGKPVYGGDAWKWKEKQKREGYGGP